MQHYNNLTPNHGRDFPGVHFPAVVPNFGVRMLCPAPMSGQMVISGVPQPVPTPYPEYDHDFPPIMVGGAQEQPRQNFNIRAPMGRVLIPTSRFVNPAQGAFQRESCPQPQSMKRSLDLLHKYSHSPGAVSDMSLDSNSINAHTNFQVRATPSPSISPSPSSSASHMKLPKSPPYASALGQDTAGPTDGASKLYSSQTKNQHGQDVVSNYTEAIQTLLGKDFQPKEMPLSELITAVMEACVKLKREERSRSRSPRKRRSRHCSRSEHNRGCWSQKNDHGGHHKAKRRTRRRDSSRSNSMIRDKSQPSTYEHFYDEGHNINRSHSCSIDSSWIYSDCKSPKRRRRKDFEMDSRSSCRPYAKVKERHWSQSSSERGLGGGEEDVGCNSRSLSRCRVTSRWRSRSRDKNRQVSPYPDNERYFHSNHCKSEANSPGGSHQDNKVLSPFQNISHGSSSDLSLSYDNVPLSNQSAFHNSSQYRQDDREKEHETLFACEVDNFLQVLTDFKNSKRHDAIPKSDYQKHVLNNDTFKNQIALGTNDQVCFNYKDVTATDLIENQQEMRGDHDEGIKKYGTGEQHDKSEIRDILGHHIVPNKPGTDVECEMDSDGDFKDCLYISSDDDIDKDQKETESKKTDIVSVTSTTDGHHAISLENDCEGQTDIYNGYPRYVYVNYTDNKVNGYPRHIYEKYLKKGSFDTDSQADMSTSYNGCPQRYTYERYSRNHEVSRIDDYNSHPRHVYENYTEVKVNRYPPGQIYEKNTELKKGSFDTDSQADVSTTYNGYPRHVYERYSRNHEASRNREFDLLKAIAAGIHSTDCHDGFIRHCSVSVTNIGLTENQTFPSTVPFDQRSDPNDTFSRHLILKDGLGRHQANVDYDFNNGLDSPTTDQSGFGNGFLRNTMYRDGFPRQHTDVEWAGHDSFQCRNVNDTLLKLSGTMDSDGFEESYIENMLKNQSLTLFNAKCLDQTTEIFQASTLLQDNLQRNGTAAKRAKKRKKKQAKGAKAKKLALEADIRYDKFKSGFQQSKKESGQEGKAESPSPHTIGVKNKLDEVGPGTVGAIDVKNKLNEVGPGTFGAIDVKNKPGTVGAIDVKNKLNEVGPGTFGAIDVKNKPGTVGAIDAKNKLDEVGPGTVGAIDVKNKLDEVGPETVGAIGVKNKPTEVGPGTVGAIGVKNKTGTVGAVGVKNKPAKDRPRTVGMKNKPAVDTLQTVQGNGDSSKPTETNKSKSKKKCPIEECTSAGVRLDTHMYTCHFPRVLDISNTVHVNVYTQKHLLHIDLALHLLADLAGCTSLQDLLDYALRDNGMSTYRWSRHAGLLQVLRAFCKYKGWGEAGSMDELIGTKSPALLLVWRTLVPILKLLTPLQRLLFATWEPPGTGSSRLVATTGDSTVTKGQ